MTLSSQPSNPAGTVTRPGIVTSQILKSCPGKTDPGAPDTYGDNASITMHTTVAPHRHHRAPRAVNPDQYRAYRSTGARAAPQMASQSVETTTRFQSAVTTATTAATTPVSAADHGDAAPSAGHRTPTERTPPDPAELRPPGADRRLRAAPRRGARHQLGLVPPVRRSGQDGVGGVRLPDSHVSP